MNIKSLAPQPVSLDFAKGVNKQKEVKTSDTGDRDADGKRNPDERPPKHQLTEEELQLVLKSLRALPGIKDKHLVVSYTEKDEHYTFFIKDPYGEIIRRLSTDEAWGLYLSHSDSEDTKGHLLDKAV
ncbi:MAG: hypothetical protein HOO06_09270 [Bdellovibrionaceae bacterium]|jgi:hypothetical protein|nr:hypothetical protein [Pseudobdellovibrionaceae bacterium]